MREGWEPFQIGDVCTVIAGQSPKGKFYNDEGDGLPFYQGKKDFGEKHLGPPRVWTTRVTKEAQAGDILMSVRAPVGPINFTGGKICIGRGLAAIRAMERVDRNFLFYLLLSKQDEITGNEGAVFASITKKQIESIPITLPPLPEQKRMVAILDEAFEGIGRAAVNAEKNLANARELFESYLNAVFRDGGEGWTKSTLGAVCTFQGGSQPPKSEFSKEWKEGYVRLVQIRDYKTDNHIVFIPKEKARRFCSTDDVMIGRYGPPLFQILRGIEGAYNVALMKAIPNENFITKDFLYYFLKNGDILRYIIYSSNRAAGQIGLNKATLEPYPITYPNKEEQNRIVSSLDGLKEDIQRLEDIYHQKLSDIAELKQSILQKAFSGELTAQPDQALKEAVA